MLSIGKFAELAQVSARTVRYYESIGLLPSTTRGENNYRSYNTQLLGRMQRIRDLQDLGFSLEEVKQIIYFSDSDISQHLKDRLISIEKEIIHLEERKKRIRELLSVSNKINIGETLTETERAIYMENIKNEVISGLKNQYSEITASTLSYLERDGWLQHHSEFNKFVEGVKKCFDFAKSKNLKLGTARGSAPASLALYGLGYTGINPMKYDLIPERLTTQSPFFHIDVEYERGQEFVDFCREINRTLPYGEIQAFKMPLIDIVKNVHHKIGQEINYNEIDENSDIVLNHFHLLDIDYIFQFDFSEEALVMNYEKFTPEYLGLDKMKNYLQGQKIYNFQDITNITALWRPYCKEIIERLELYKIAKQSLFKYDYLSENINTWLKPNFGVIIYHEDLIKIISEYTGWSFAQSNSLRRSLIKKQSAEALAQNQQWLSFKNLVSPKIAELVREECQWAFCKPHAISFSQFTKQTAILKSLHKNIYINEIKNFEQKHGITWDDIGIRIKGVSLHQG